MGFQVSLGMQQGQPLRLSETACGLGPTWEDEQSSPGPLWGPEQVTAVLEREKKSKELFPDQEKEY